MAFGSNIPAVSAPTESTFKNYPVLTLPNPSDPSKPGVQLGTSKLRAVLAHLDAVRAFVAKHDKPKAPSKLDAIVAALKAAGSTPETIAAAVAALQAA